MTETFSVQPKFELPKPADMVAMLRLVNGVYAAAHDDRGRLLLTGLLHLLDAVAATLAIGVHQTTVFAPSNAPIVRRRRAALAGDVVMRELRTNACSRPVLRQVLKTDDATNSPLGSVLYSAHPPLGGSGAVIAVYRSGDADRFATREQLILRLVHGQCDASLRPLSSNLLPRLTPRVQGVLELLLAGHSEAAIARLVGRSPHTVHSHCKSIYRQFKVNTRSELLARFVRRDANVKPASK